MAFVECQPGHEHVAVEAAGVGEVTLTHNDNRVIHMYVHEVNIEVDVDRCLAPEALNRELHQPCFIWEG